MPCPSWAAQIICSILNGVIAKLCSCNYQTDSSLGYIFHYPDFFNYNSLIVFVAFNFLLELHFMLISVLKLSDVIWCSIKILCDGSLRISCSKKMFRKKKDV